MAITTASAKAKARALQQLVRDRIMAAFPTLRDGDVVSTSMGAPGADIVLSPAAQEVFPFKVECKARKGIALIYDALEQADRHKGAGEPVAIVKADRKRPLAVIDLELFLKLTLQAEE
jgi:hypothetical protein